MSAVFLCKRTFVCSFYVEILKGDNSWKKLFVGVFWWLICVIHSLFFVSFSFRFFFCLYFLKANFVISCISFLFYCLSLSHSFFSSFFLFSHYGLFILSFSVVFKFSRSFLFLSLLLALYINSLLFISHFYFNDLGGIFLYFLLSFFLFFPHFRFFVSSPSFRSYLPYVINKYIKIKIKCVNCT